MLRPWCLLWVMFIWMKPAVILPPAGLFMYLDEELRHPVTIQMTPYSKWSRLVATGLDTIPGKYHVYKADDFDVLYDSPFLMGELEVLPPFNVQNKPHNFIGYKLPAFDRQGFMDDLKKIVETGSGIIGEIPYTHYTFFIDRCRWWRVSNI